MEQFFTVLGWVLSPVVLVEVVKQAVAGVRQRRRAKRQKVTELDLLIESRRRYREHAEELRAWALKRGCTDLPDWPDDPWPPKDNDND